MEHRIRSSQKKIYCDFPIFFHIVDEKITVYHDVLIENVHSEQILNHNGWFLERVEAVLDDVADSPAQESEATLQRKKLETLDKDIYDNITTLPSISVEKKEVLILDSLTHLFRGNIQRINSKKNLSLFAALLAVIDRCQYVYEECKRQRQNAVSASRIKDEFSKRYLSRVDVVMKRTDKRARQLCTPVVDLPSSSKLLSEGATATLILPSRNTR